MCIRDRYHTVYEGADERQCFTKYLTLGGMPYLSNLSYDDAASCKYLQDLFNSVAVSYTHLDVYKRQIQTEPSDLRLIQ